MPDYNIAANITDPTMLASTTATNVPVLGGGLLFSLFMIILGTSYFTTERKFGRADIWLSATLASLTTTTIAFILFILPPSRALLNIYIVGVCFAVFVGCTIAYGFTKNE